MSFVAVHYPRALKFMNTPPLGFHCSPFRNPTAVQVDKVKALKISQPTVTEVILDGIGKVITSALECISSAALEGDDITDALEHMGTLMRVNHGFLVSLGVSHPRLERIRELVYYADIGWTKLTGAGGGGCAITLFRPGIKDGTLEALDRDFTAEDFQTYKTILGADGVGVLWPAVFRHDAEEKGGEEIDQKRFEDAVGTHGIEQLVGVGAQGNRVGWKFWIQYH